MKNTALILLSIVVLAGSLLSLERPEQEILLRFFRNRLSTDSTWIASSRCAIVSSQDTTIAEGIDTLGDTIIHCDYSEAISPFAPNLKLLCFPLRLAQMEYDSIRINKTRTRVKGIMCWKFRIYLGDETIACYVSGDGFFRTMKMERKGRGKAKSDDVWEFFEVRRGKDLPCKITRSVEFEWGGKPMQIRSTRELANFRAISAAKP